MTNHLALGIDATLLINRVMITGIIEWQIYCREYRVPAVCSKQPFCPELMKISTSLEIDSGIIE